MTTATTTKPNLNKRIRVSVSGGDITNSECRDPNKCMVKVATVRAVRIPHGYVHVDSTGVSITRRKDYREKAFLPKIVMKNMLKFDREEEVKPFSFMLEFHKTTRVSKATAERKEQVNKVRRAKLARGIRAKRYNLHRRVVGMSEIVEPRDK